MVTYKELLDQKIITRIEKVEKEMYVSFHQQNYKIDLESAINFLDLGNSKYAVIAGYYAVLNSTLWNLAKFFNLKISEKDFGVHTNCLIVLEEFVKDKELKKKILELLDLAKQEYTSFTTIKKDKEKTLPLMFKNSSEKRKRYTYYSLDRKLPGKDDMLNESKLFIENVVKPYILIMENLK